MEMKIYQSQEEVNTLKIEEFKEEILSISLQEEIKEFAKEGSYACLAAPQLGMNSRFFLLNDKFYFNPYTESIDESGKSTFEVCENFTDKRIESVRYKWIEISYQEGGETHTEKFTEEEAQYVQFCMDWLDNSMGPLIETIKQDTVKLSDEVIGRNDPCPCKSGKKYKKCCGKR